MRPCTLFFAGVLTLLMLGTAAQAEIQTTAEYRSNENASPDFKFPSVPAPSASDAATSATMTVVAGRSDRNGGDVGRLHDGRVPRGDDQPSRNFFFAAGSEGGRLLVDLGEATDIQRVNTYSWHSGPRGPQVYTLYASDGNAAGFDARPKKETDPKGCGWALIAKVDTRPAAGEGGGQHAVSIHDSDGPIGKYRYLLFDVARTETADPFGHTFYSEIDVDDGRVREAAATAEPQPRREIVEIEDAKYRIVLDTTESPDLTEWARLELAPVVRQWYPKLVAMLPSEGYEAPRSVTITFSDEMQGVAATGGTNIGCAAAWFRRSLQGEAKGAVVHELVHVVQQFGRARRAGPDAVRTPGWVVEGMADYIRWFLYEPETHGAEISARGAATARYDASYRVSGNFLNWVTATYDKQLLQKLNAAAREGRYSEQLWKDSTGHTLEELGQQWKASLQPK